VESEDEEPGFRHTQGLQLSTRDNTHPELELTDSSRREVLREDTTVKIDAAHGFLAKLELQTLRKYEKTMNGISKQTIEAGQGSESVFRAAQMLLEGSLRADGVRQISAVYHGCVRSTTLMSWVSQAELLFINMLVCEWLEGIVIGSWDDTPSAATWDRGVHALIRDLLDLQKVRPVSRMLDASDYLPGFKKGECTHLVAHKRKRHLELKPEDICDHTIEILSRFLDLPDPKKQRPRAWYTRLIVSRIGLGAMLLKPFLKASNRIGPSLFGIHPSATVSFNMLHRWADVELRNHAISDEASGFRTLAENITHRIMSLSLLNESLMNEAQTPQQFPWSMVNMLGLPVDFGDEDLPFPTTSSLVPSDTSTHSQSGLPNVQEFERWYEMIMVLEPLIDNLAPPAGPKLSLKGYLTPEERLAVLKERYIDFVRKGSDKKLPFRDSACSRKRVLEATGPFSAEYLSTISGLFSSFLYRGITHSTDFLMEHQTVFNDHEEWKELVDSLVKAGKDKEYICNANAFGTWTRRSADHALEYWNAANNTDFNFFLFVKEPVPFLSLYKLFSKLAQFGPLTAAQLTIDYATAGKATMPSYDDMADVILDIDGGGMAGLRKLGFTVSNRKDISNALRLLHDEFAIRMHSDLQVRMNLGVTFLEHALCKSGTNRLDCGDFKRYWEELGRVSRMDTD